MPATPPSRGTRPGESGGALRRRVAPDPLGKRALFWAPGRTSASDAADPSGPGPAPAAVLGKRALYSHAGESHAEEGASGDPLTERGMLTVTCSRCHAVRRIGLLDFVIYQLPVGFWLPRGRFDRRMTCPACRRRVWASVTLTRD